MLRLLRIKVFIDGKKSLDQKNLQIEMQNDFDTIMKFADNIRQEFETFCHTECKVELSALNPKDEIVIFKNSSSSNPIVSIVGKIADAH